MKKLFYALLIFLVSLIVLVVIAANSSFVIKKAADAFAPDYNISYADITGNILTGVKIKELKFKDQRIAEEVGFSWNPAKLLYERIAVNHIRAKRLNVDAIRALVDSFPASAEENSSSPPFPLTVTVGSVDIGIDPFVQQGVAIEKTLIKVSDIFYASDRLGVEKLTADIDSNVTTLHLEASLDKGVVDVEHLDIKRLDTLALQALFTPSESNTTVVQKDQHGATATKEKEADESGKKSALIPHTVRIEELHTDLLPARYAPVEMHDFNLDVKGLLLDVEKLLVKEGTVDVKATTNLVNIREHGLLRDNRMEGHIVLTPNQPLFDLYAPMVRKEAIGDISLDVNASKESVSVDLFAKATHLFVVPQESNATDVNVSDGNMTDTNTTGPIIVDIDHLKTHLLYKIESGRLDADLKIAAKTPFTKGLTLQANAQYEGEKLHYSGVLGNGQVTLPGGERVKPMEDLKIRFEGGLNTLKTTIDAAGIAGYFNVEDFSRKGHFHLKTIQPVKVADLAPLPADFNATEVNAVIDLPLNFQKPTPLHGTAKITSNVVNIDAAVTYGKKSALKIEGRIPQNSLLKQLDKNIRWEAVSPFKVAVDVAKKDIAASIRSSKIDAKIKIDPYKEIVEGRISLAGLLTTLETKKDRSVVIETSVDSIARLLSTANHFYHIPDLPKVKGKAVVTLMLSHQRPELLLTLTSPHVVYYADRQTTHEIDDVKAVLSSNEKEIRLSSYQLIYNKMKFFATKPSVVYLQKERLTIKELWLNDQLKVTGDVNLKTMQGEILAQANPLHFSHEMVELDSKVDIKARLNGENTDISGKVTLLGGKVHYDLSAQTFPSDSDILIVQEMKKREPSPFMDHLTMQVQVDTQNSLVYKQGPVDVKARAEIFINKAPLSAPIVTGAVNLDDGSSYTFQGKRFVLERSHIFFTGDPTKPMLDLTVKYQALRHLITINVTGTPAVPNILFSSVPSLTKEQILSIILFDSEEAAGSNNANDMMKMMGGAMAKSALNDLGVKIDHLVIGEGNSVEVGTKLTDKVTVIYINADVPKMQMKYKYSPSIEVVLGASEQSESLDVIYIKDFNLDSKKDDDIVIKRKK